MRNQLLGALIVVALLAGGCAADKETKDNLTAGYEALNHKQYDEALQRADVQLSKTPQGPGSTEALYLRGRVYEELWRKNGPDAASDLANARGAYMQALQQSPPHALAAYIHTSLGNIDYWQDNYTEALGEWTAAYDLIDKNDDLKSFVLYRAGLCQQRLGDFDVADRTFAAVQERFPDSDAAKRAREHQGFRNFIVRLATFANPAAADVVVGTLQRQGANPRRATDPQGHTYVMLGPVQTYPQALSLKARFAQQFPDAMIIP